MKNPLSQETNPAPRKPKRDRDLSNFIKIRSANPGDDPSVAELLVHTFVSTYQEKLPGVVTTDERVRELRNVAGRRKQGYVGVAELGYRIIGTFALIHQNSPDSEAWEKGGATLRCVAVDPEFHGLELSTLLLSHADSVAKLWGSTGIYLHVQNGADRVAKLYEDFGYARDPSGDKTSFACELLGYAKTFSTLHVN